MPLSAPSQTEAAAYNFVDVARFDDVPSGTGIAVTIEGMALAVFNVNGRIYAIEDTCVRCGSPLATGQLAATVIQCSGCDWRYDITTGCVAGMSALRIDSFDVRIVSLRHIMIATTAKAMPSRR
jgi:nitrite reductase/ring-hydroxylating ferredoxin subunit